MLEVCTHRFLFFSRKEFWFYAGENIKKAPYSVFCYSEEPEAKNKYQVLKEETSLIYLDKMRAELLAALSRTCKTHIRRAEKMNFRIDVKDEPDHGICNQVLKEFSLFAKNKAIQWNPRRIKAAAKIKRLIITEIFLEKQKLCTHIYLHDQKRIVLLHSYHQAGADRKILAYANKWLHWNDMLRFKELGMILYDFGGLNFREHQGISRFKAAFGGETRTCYSYIETTPVWGGFMKAFRKLK